jgi:hypothetical protein
VFPASRTDCPYPNSRGRCLGWVDGYEQAILDAVSAGYLDQAFSPLSLSDAQSLLPSIILVLATAFGARLIIQLVKG